MHETGQDAGAGPAALAGVPLAWVSTFRDATGETPQAADNRLTGSLSNVELAHGRRRRRVPRARHDLSDHHRRPRRDPLQRRPQPDVPARGHALGHAMSDRARRRRIAGARRRGARSHPRADALCSVAARGVPRRRRSGALRAARVRSRASERSGESQMTQSIERIRARRWAIAGLAARAAADGDRDPAVPGRRGAERLRLRELPVPRRRRLPGRSQRPARQRRLRRHRRLRDHQLPRSEPDRHRAQPAGALRRGRAEHEPGLAHHDRPARRRDRGDRRRRAMGPERLVPEPQVLHQPRRAADAVRRAEPRRHDLRRLRRERRRRVQLDRLRGLRLRPERQRLRRSAGPDPHLFRLGRRRRQRLCRRHRGLGLLRERQRSQRRRRLRRTATAARATRSPRRASRTASARTAW